MYDLTGLGSCCMDCVAMVDRFATKHDKITVKSLQEFPGGVTANMLVQAARLGLKTAWCGALGKDDAGAKLVECFKRERVNCNAFYAKATQCAWIAVDSRGEKQIYVFLNGNIELTPKIVSDKFGRLIENCRHFHTEVANIPLSAAIKGAQIAEKAKARIFLDVDADTKHLIKTGIGTKRQLAELLCMADVIKLSESSAKSLAGNKRTTIRGLLETAEIVAVTLGSKGCIIADRKQTIRCPALKVKCVDSTGAGDAFMGGLSYAILKKMKLRDIGMFANACGAYCCTRVGARSSGKLADIGQIRH